jgi:hypothetical protein
LTSVPLFHRDDPASAPTDPDELQVIREHFAGLSLPDRCAEVLQAVPSANRSSNDPTGWQLISILRIWLPVPYADWSQPLHQLPEQQRATAWAVRLLIVEALQTLVLTRLLVLHSVNDSWHYELSADGRAALDRDDVTDVVARRLPD